MGDSIRLPWFLAEWCWCHRVTSILWSCGQWFESIRSICCVAQSGERKDLLRFLQRGRAVSVPLAVTSNTRRKHHTFLADEKEATWFGNKIVNAICPWLTIERGYSRGDSSNKRRGLSLHQIVKSKTKCCWLQSDLSTNSFGQPIPIVPGASSPVHRGALLPSILPIS